MGGLAVENEKVNMLSCTSHSLQLSMKSHGSKAQRVPKASTNYFNAAD